MFRAYIWVSVPGFGPDPTRAATLDGDVLPVGLDGEG